MQQSLQRLQKKRSQRQVAVLLGLEVPAHLIKMLVRANGVLELLQGRQKVLQVLVVKWKDVEQSVVEVVADVVPAVGLPARKTRLYLRERRCVGVGDQLYQGHYEVALAFCFL